VHTPAKSPFPGRPWTLTEYTRTYATAYVRRELCWKMQGFPLCPSNVSRGSIILYIERSFKASHQIGFVLVLPNTLKKVCATTLSHQLVRGPAFVTRTRTPPKSARSTATSALYHQHHAPIRNLHFPSLSQHSLGPNPAIQPLKTATFSSPEHKTYPPPSPPCLSAAN
jgi:hypothetical protein